jgi:methylase of polypeptide subunit release factors
MDSITLNKEQYSIFTTTGFRNMKVFYRADLDGGGTWYGTEYPTIVKQLYPNRIFTRCYEWCSGPGFIGYSLLDHGICQSLCLSDLWYPAIEAAELTKLYSDNDCSDKVTTYLLNDLALLPEHEYFDLIVANPPHFPSKVSQKYNNNRICTDTNWQAHQNFFKNIKSHLTSDGIILLQESMVGSTSKDFEEFIDSADLQITNVIKSKDFFEDNKAQIYYIEITHKHENIS